MERMWGGRFEEVARVTATDALEVLDGVDSESGRAVLIEAYRPGAGDDTPIRKAHFLDTVAALAAFDHAQLGDVVFAGYDNDRYFVVVSGAACPSLAALLEADPPPTQHCIRSVAVDLADLLVAAGHAGVVHGTLSAESVLVSDRGIQVIGWATGALTRSSASSTAGTEVTDLRALISIVEDAAESSGDTELRVAATRLSQELGNDNQAPTLADARRALLAVLEPQHLLAAADTSVRVLATGSEDSAEPVTPPLHRVLGRRGRLVAALLAVGVLVGLGIFSAGQLRQIPIPRVPVAVPDVVGMAEQNAQESLTSSGFKIRRQTQASPVAEQGTVMLQRPKAPARLESGSDVVMVISTGGSNVAVPNVIGLPQAKATDLLAAANLTPDFRTDEKSSEPAGTILLQSPEADGQAREGDRVVLVVSDGP